MVGCKKESANAIKHLIGSLMTGVLLTAYFGRC